MTVCRGLAAVNDTTNRTLKECMYSIVEQAKWNKGVFILILNRLRRFLEPRKHGAFASGKMLAGVPVLSYLGKDILHQTELIWDKRVGFNKVILTRVSLQIQNGIIECEEVLQNSAILTII